jgi:glycine cleavage system aminomethyltransferase T
MSSIEAVKRTPAHRLHATLGARFDRRDGWEIAAAYAPIDIERDAIRDGLGFADVTPRGKLDLRGTVDEILTRLAPGPDLHVARVSARSALILAAPGDISGCLAAAERAAGQSGMATDVTCVYTGIAVLGPNAGGLLARLTSLDISTVGPGRAAGLQLARIPAILVRGEKAIELYAASEFGRYLWQTIAQTAAPLNGRAVGWDALMAEGWR